ncbi:hypothetical protein MCANUF33_01188 [Mycoplasmopsis canis UF33]|nr:hypothetical protein MCANUF33_01188 [Mycoplasmopsis canis UF33]
MTQFLKKYEILFWFLFLIISLLLIILEIIGINLFLGFAIGSLLSYVLFKMTAISYFKLFKEKKKIYLILVPFKMLIFFILLSGITFFIKEINVMHLKNENVSWVNGRINFITFAFSLSFSGLIILSHKIIDKIKIFKKYRRAHEWT